MFNTKYSISLERRSAKHQSSLVFTDSLLIVSTEDVNAANGIIYALNRHSKSLSVSWSYKLPSNSVVRFPVLLPLAGSDLLLLGGTNFTTTSIRPQYDNHLIALDAATGSLLWKFPATCGIGDISSPLPLADGIFLIAETQEGTQAFLISTVDPNKIIWRKSFPFRFPQNLSVADETMIYINVGERGVVGYRQTDGEMSRVYHLSGEVAEGQVILSPAVMENYLVVGTSRGYVAVFDKSTQVQLWYKWVGRDITTGPVVIGDRIFVGSKKGSVQQPELVYQINALDLRDGSKIWDTPFEQPERHHFHAPLVEHNGFLLCGSDSGKLFMVDIDNGAGEELYRFEKQIYCGATVSPDGYIFAMDLKTNVVGLKLNEDVFVDFEEEPGRAYLAQMPKLIAKYFSKEELKTFCYELGVDYENLSSSGKRNKARELVHYMNRRSSLQSLADKLSEERPKIKWPRIPKSNLNK